MAEVKQVKTVCRNCHGGCGVVAHVAGGKVVKVEGDPDSPISHGSMCAKGLAVTQMAYHPDRILHPMKKKWRRLAADILGRGPGHGSRQVQRSPAKIWCGIHTDRTGHGP